ncbi:MAG: glutamyl-tRNA reductase [Deltaproteobacteria bacterium]|jgi:glutamyl-tRNA reductase|nr:glutamyl-tRNA reductase [Deltaproteobacteria bacterium]
MEREIYLIGLNHRTAGVEVRESFALSNALLPGGVFADLLPGHNIVQSPAGNSGRLLELLVLSTCNRVEILAVAASGVTSVSAVAPVSGSAAAAGEDLPDQIIRCWAEAKGRKAEELKPYVYCHRGDAAVRHLFSVASSLDSMVLGEPQILGQLKNAYKQALDGGATKVILNRLLHKAFSVAKRVRSETGVASSAVSISYAAVELARRIFGDMSGHTAMLIGAGEMAELAATHLLNAGIKQVLVANRTHSRALELAERYNGLAVPFASLFNHLHEADIIISSTGAPETVISASNLAGVMKKRKNRPMFFIDIAVPRDIDPDVNSLDNIYLYDIDDLKEVVEENQAQRQAEAVKAREIVAEETDAFLRWQDSLQLQPTITDLIRRTESIAESELERTLRRLKLDAESELALRAMLRSIAKKLNHQPITFLKQRYAEEDAGKESGDEVGEQFISLVRRLYDLDNEEVLPDAPTNSKKN